MIKKWEIHLGTVPGIVLGYRNYVNQDICTVEHVLNFGIVDISLTLYYDC